jgi:large subunit ribosomal protein L6
MSKKYTIKIPNDNIILYCEKKKILTIIGPLAQKALKLKLKIKILSEQKSILITPIPLSKLSNNQRKRIKALQGTTLALIKQVLIETSAILYQKLKFIGVGYRTFDVQNFEKKLLMFKLGYSHPIYFKIPEDLKIFCLKLTKLFIYGNSYHSVTKVASSIQSYKLPEPYKGKGILYENEKIQLKKGKKI